MDNLTFSIRANGVNKTRRILAEQNARYGSELVDVTHELPHRPKNLLRVLRSRKYIVQIYAYPNRPVRLSIQRTQIDKKGELLDGLTWDELQAIKNEAGYEDFECVEVYPKADNVVNVANIRHLWVMDMPLEWVWRAGEDE